jgi:uncharacterized protein with PIN domain
MEKILQELIENGEKLLNTTSQWNANIFRKSLDKAKNKLTPIKQVCPKCNSKIIGVYKHNEKLQGYCFKCYNKWSK